MTALKRNVNIFVFAFFIGLLIGGVVHAEFIIWVGDDRVDERGDYTDQGFIDLLEYNGYDVQRETHTMAGSPLTTEQIDVLESADLIIVGRSTSSGDYNDPAGWNQITKPLISITCYLSRANRWQWFNSDALIDDGGCPKYHVEIPDHPIFTGVTLDADGNVAALDSTFHSGNTSLVNWGEVGDDGVLIATSVHPLVVPNAVAIAYWPMDAAFYAETDQFAGGPRLLFLCGTREFSGQTDWGYYNLTPDGDTLFLNAVAWMLGKGVGVKDKPSSMPTDYNLAQNFPNPFNPSTTIEFTIPSNSQVKLGVYNMLGQQIALLTNQLYQAGTFSISWDGLDNFAQPVESGVYLYRLESDDITLTKKMLMIK